MTDNRRKKISTIWPFVLNFLLFAAIASVSPFLVLYYQGLGFTGTQIGLLTGITPLITFFSAPLWTGLADATRRHRFIMSLAILVGVITLSVFPLLHEFVPVLLISILLNIFLAPVTSFADAATMFMLADKREMYGRIRLGGTIGYGLSAALAGALVQNHGLKFAFWGCAALFFLGLIVSQQLVYGQLKGGDPAEGRVRVLLTNPHWILFLVIAFAGGSALAAINNYFFPYMKELGAKESMMGLALTIGTATEIPVLFFGDRLIKRFKSYGLLMLAMVITGIRLLLLAAAGTPDLALVIQLLNGLTFPAMWMAGVSYADESAPEGMKTTAQGLFGAMVFGFGMAIGGFIGGLLLESLSGRGLYLVFGVAVLAIVVIVALIQRRLQSRRHHPAS
ncbi:MAG: MFS transporter [Anaerolineae bacterium]|nr:MFS transporter [Anaerolineae bacterium]